MSFFGASRRVFDLSLGEMLWSRRTIFMALVVGGPVLLAVIVKAVEMFGMSQPTISHHLNILKQFKLVTSRKEGKLVFYDINRNNVVQCCGQLMAKFEAEDACQE